MRSSNDGFVGNGPSSWQCCKYLHNLQQHNHISKNTANIMESNRTEETIVIFTLFSLVRNVPVTSQLICEEKFSPFPTFWHNDVHTLSQWCFSNVMSVFSLILSILLSILLILAQHNTTPQYYDSKLLTTYWIYMNLHPHTKSSGHNFRRRRGDWVPSYFQIQATWYIQQLGMHGCDGIGSNHRKGKTSSNE